ncbi:MAG: hypothetical protein AAF389_11900 [Gemmatimonadota bacterium]
MTMQRLRTAALVGVLAAAAPGASHAQVADTTDLATAVAGVQYQAGPLHRWILGRHYRDLWSTPIQVPILDLDGIAGGLTPTRTGGGMQTRSLRFDGADGREYAFRSVDKDPSPVLDTIFHGTVVNDLVQDGISAAHPFGALVAAPLLDAVGILHVDPQLVVMPDDPRLGEYRAEFAGMLGLFEERPDENEGDRTAFRGSERVIASEALTDRLDRGPNDLVDARAFLRARLVDVFLGDWDRHRGQWRWATYDDEAPRSWLPVPRDRDQAFSKFDGVATRIVSLYLPQFVRFEENYPSIKRLHWNGRALDRWFLSGLDRSAWDEVGSEIQAALTDDIIEQAVLQLPAAVHEINGEELASALRARRDALPEALDEFYSMLADKVDIRASHADEVVEVDWVDDETLSVTVTAPDEDDEPYLTRRFHESETREVRLYLRDGDDRVVFSGEGRPSTLVRVIGGEDDDTYDFRSRSGRVQLYDHEGANGVEGDGPDIDDRPFEVWEWSEEDRDQPVDWGKRTFPIFWSGYSSDLGVLIGGGARIVTYGFQKHPVATDFDVRGAFSPQTVKGIFEVDGRINRENSSLFWTVAGRVSRLDVLSYYGLGNDQPVSGSEAFHEVDLTRASASVGFGVSPEPWFELSGFARIERSSTQENAGQYFETLGPVYGAGEFIAASVGGRLVFDPLIGDQRTGNRFRLHLFGEVFPKALDAERTFGRAGGDLSVLLATSTWPGASIALRGGGEQAHGRFPWHRAAFLGGTGTLRGYDEHRFAGESSLWGSAEVRLRVAKPRVVVPVGLGLFGFTDTGRVFVDGESPGGWRTALGGGVFLHPIAQPYLFRIGVGSTDEATKVFVSVGLPY